MLAVMLLLTACSSSNENNDNEVIEKNTASATVPGNQNDSETENDDKMFFSQSTDYQEGEADNDRPNMTGDNSATSVPGSAANSDTSTDSGASTDGVNSTGTAKPSASADNSAVTGTAKPTATAKQNIATTQEATAKPTSPTKPGITSSTAPATKKPTATATSKPTATTATAKPTNTASGTTSTVKPTATVKPTSTTASTPTPTVKPVTYSFSPSNVTVYSGDDTDIYIKVVASNGQTVSISELDLDWYDLGDGRQNFNRNTSQAKGSYSVSDANVARLSGMIYADGTERLSVNGYWGKLGTTTIKCKHISGQILTLTVKSIKDPQYAAYYHPYNWEVIDADMKAYIERKNATYDTSMSPETCGYFPGATYGSYSSQGRTFHDSLIGAIDSTISSLVYMNHGLMTEDDLKSSRLYLWRNLTSGTVGEDDEMYLIRVLYG